ncbi:DUF2325 domain-containing protein [Virgibacillus halodenitrificans]|uniref:DUF2325 domain-containing protein n=1 Tax=Virgibacillus halodenitrificans TaxID=1482 RepID=UPI000EF54EE8|nr:DUF2325 domain-containing protein [Virgibacillus halodenitrificans]
MVRKEKILIELKNELIEKIDGLTYENAEETSKEVQAFFDVVQGIRKLSFEAKNVINEKIKETEDEPKIETKEIITEEPTPDNVGNIGKSFTFHRKLCGGIIPNLDGGYFIPEKMTRDMNLEDGDSLKIIDEKIIHNNETKYSFEILEKSKTVNNKRIEIPFCKVDIEAGEYVVNESLSGFIKLDEVPYTLILQERDKHRLRLKKGDIVDVAFYENNPSKVRVIWKHDIKDHPTITEEEKKLQYKHQYDKNSAEKAEKNYPVSLELFHNKKILIIGGENRHADYRNAFDELPIELEMIKGTEETKRLQSAIKRADIVTIVIGEARHRASVAAVQFCKDTQKPFDTTHENGIQSVLLCTEKAIRKGIKQRLIECVG